MSDIELVIKIPKKWFDDMVREEFEDVDELCAVIQHSTLLPKGHGRMVDYGYVVDAIDDWVNAEEYRYTNATDYLRNRIKNVPTFIKEDRSERRCGKETAE